MNAVTKTEERSPTVDFRDQFKRMDSEIGAALPPHIPVERFMRVVLTAVNASPDLLKADRRSLFESAMKAAQDGLLPDGRDGAFVTFGNKVQWMPMIGGILKKIRNSGDLLTISAQVAYENDRFTYILGDDEKIEHEPAMGERGKARLAYAIARTKDGGIYREVMSIADIEKVRSVSRAKNNGPWVQWWDEMAKKTVLRRLAKRLPMSSDLDDLIRRDDELYDLKGGGSERQASRLFRPIASPLSDEAPAIEHDGAESPEPPASSPPFNPASSSAEDDTAQAGPGGLSTAGPADTSDDDFPGDTPPRGRRKAPPDLIEGEDA